MEFSRILEEFKQKLKHKVIVSTQICKILDTIIRCGSYLEDIVRRLTKKLWKYHLNINRYLSSPGIFFFGVKGKRHWGERGEMTITKEKGNGILVEKGEIIFSTSFLPKLSSPHMILFLSSFHYLLKHIYSVEMGKVWWEIKHKMGIAVSAN